MEVTASQTDERLVENVRDEEEDAASLGSDDLDCLTTTDYSIKTSIVNEINSAIARRDEAGIRGAGISERMRKVDTQLKELARKSQCIVELSAQLDRATAAHQQDRKAFQSQTERLKSKIVSLVSELEQTAQQYDEEKRKASMKRKRFVSDADFLSMQRMLTEQIKRLERSMAEQDVDYRSRHSEMERNKSPSSMPSGCN